MCTTRLVYVTIIQSIYPPTVGAQMVPPRTLISVAEFEEGFYRAVRAVYGPRGGIEEVHTGVTALYEASK